MRKEGCYGYENYKFFRENSEIGPFPPPKTAEKAVENREFQEKTGCRKAKTKIILIDNQRVAEKMKKKCPEVLRGKGKPPIFAVPIERETGCKPRGKEGESDWECSLKEWKDVANTQGFF